MTLPGLDTIRGRLYVMIFCLGVILLIFIMNVFFYKLVWNINRQYNRVLSFEKDFFYLTFNEDSKSLGSNGTDSLETGYRKLLEDFDIPGFEKVRTLVERKLALLTEFESVSDKAYTLFHDISRNLQELYLSVRYIHKHHITYFKNFLADPPNNNSEFRRIDEDTFEKSSVREAPQPDIIGCAVEIQNALYQLMNIFYKLRLDADHQALVDRFRTVIGKFYSDVDRFEKYSLDAQDGLLVEELLKIGRVYERSFTRLLNYKERLKKLENLLTSNRNEIFDTVKAEESSLRRKYYEFSNYMISLQFFSIFIATWLVIWLVSSSREIIRQIGFAIEETKKIKQTPSCTIDIPARTLGEFRVLYEALNSMSDTIYRQLKALNDEIKQRRTVEQELRKLFFAIEQSPNAVMITDLALNIEYVNPKFAELTGKKRENVLNEGADVVKQIFSHTNPFEDVLNTDGALWQSETTIDSSDGRVHVNMSVSPIRDREGNIVNLLCIMQDITQRKKLEDELRRRERIESIGLLAGGIAHDFNNILTAISGNISLAHYLCETDGKVAQKLENALKACQQAKALTWQLLTFSKGGTPIKKTSSLEQIVQETAQFVLAGSNVKIDFSADEDLWPVEVDKGQISQVINNLIINADQAMPEGGIITLRLKNVSVDENSALPLTPGSYVLLEIKDQGVGIPEKHLEKIFDPYFTTKARGSGLGLATAYSIIKQHDGCITVSSRPGVGTTFHIYLPASIHRTRKRDRDRKTKFEGNIKILFMDDEEPVRQVAKEMLETLGHKVTTVKDGDELIGEYAAAMKDGTSYDLVIMDLTIPGGMGGKETMARLRNMDAGVKAIVASGYSNDPVMSRFEEYGFSGVIKKPFSLSDLKEAISAVFTEAEQTRR